MKKYSEVGGYQIRVSQDIFIMLKIVAAVRDIAVRDITVKDLTNMLLRNELQSVMSEVMEIIRKDAE